MKQRLTGEPTTIEVHAPVLRSGHLVGNLGFTGRAKGSSDSLSVEKRIEALEQEITHVRAAISAQANDLSGRIDLERTDSEARASAIQERITVAEREVDKIDAVAFNSEMLGVVSIALGTLIQAVSTLA